MIITNGKAENMRVNRFGAATTWIGLCVATLLTAFQGHAAFGQQQLSASERRDQFTKEEEFKGEVPPRLRLLSGKLFRTGGSAVSSDDGKTWTEGGRPHEIGVDLTSVYAQSLPESEIQLQAGPHKGRILVPWYAEMDGDHPDYTREQRGGYAIWKGQKLLLETHTHVPEMGGCFVCYSDDEGKTWQKSKGLMMGYFEDGTLGCWSCEEPQIAELKDGRVLCFMRSQCGRILKSYSSDGGERWTKVEATDLPMSNSPCALARLPKTGDLVLVWNQVSGPEICKGYRRGRLSMAISKDDGKTWENYKTLELSDGVEDRKRVEPPPLAPMVRGSCGPDEPMGTIADGYTVFDYPQLHLSEEKVFITYGVQALTGPGKYSGTYRTRVFPVSSLYEQ